MKTIRQTYQIKAPLEKVWQALVDPEMIEAWGAGPAKMDDKVGTRFELWDGDIHGTNVEIVPEEKLVQDWFGGDWPEPSRVTFTLTSKGQTTQIDLLHENVPDDEAHEIDDGWNRYYLGQIKQYLEG